MIAQRYAVRVRLLKGGRAAATRRRAGFQFGNEPRDLTREELGEGVEGMKRLCMIFGDPELVVSFVDGEEEHALTEEQKDHLLALTAAEELRVDRGNPPELISELTTLGGSKPEAEGAAALTGDGGEKAPDSTAADAADPAKADDASAAASEQAREQAGGAAPDQKAAPTEEQEPGTTVPAPVAEPDTAPADDRKPAGEETASPAAEATGSTKQKRAKV